MLGFKYSVFQHRHFIPFLSASHCFEHSTFFIYLKHSYINSWLASDQSNLFNLTAFTQFVAIVRSFSLCTVLIHWRGTNESTENYITEFQCLSDRYSCSICVRFCVCVAYRYVYLWFMAWSMYYRASLHVRSDLFCILHGGLRTCISYAVARPG